MLITAGFGLLINLAMAKVLHSGISSHAHHLITLKKSEEPEGALIYFCCKGDV